MLDHLPSYIPLTFIASTLATLLITYWVVYNSERADAKKLSIRITVILASWLVLQAALALNNVYSADIDSLPPKIFLYGVLPNILIIIGLFTTTKGRAYIDSLSLEKITYLNLVRIPVEFILLWLYMYNTIPKTLTFEGWNFDIVMGLTAPFIIYFGYKTHKLPKNAMLAWNVLGLLLLSFVFIMALLSAPFPLQQIAFDQPMTGLLYFPFSWLPTFVVPIVILGHLISIRQLLEK